MRPLVASARTRDTVQASMNQSAINTEEPPRPDLVKRGQGLEYFTIAYNSLEGLIAIVAGIIAGSIALVGFGFDSVIEVTSGAALLWRLHADMDEERRERVELLTLRIVGVCFLALALYVAYDAVSSLTAHELPERSIPGILLAVASLIVMPLLARRKRKVALVPCLINTLAGQAASNS